MNAPERPAAPASGTSPDDGPTVEELVADPEIAALLDFEPVPRKREVEGAWTPELQRDFIARLAATGSPGRASEEMGKTETGVRKLYRSPAAASFRAAWHSAVELAKRRKAALAPAEVAVVPGSRPPSLDHRRKHDHFPAEEDAWDEWAEGEALNERGQWEDDASFQQRVDDARDSISNKLTRLRRLYLQEISASPGKRAAFEILTELPVDWERAERLEPQPDEPWRRPSLREPDMLLAAENGWLGDFAHGPNKLAELRRAVDEHREAEGLPAIDWEDEASPPLNGEGQGVG